MKSVHPIKNLFLGFILLLVSTLSMGQEKFNISAGVGYPELLNLGLRFQLEQSQWGIYGGALPADNDKGFSLGVDYYYHYGGTSNFSSRRPWFVKAGLNYYYIEEPFNENTYVLLLPRIGRDLNLSPRIGIALDGGLFIVLVRSEEDREPGELSPWASGNLPAIGPGFSLNVFYRL